MLKKVYEYVSTHGIILMIAGFLIAVAGLLVYMQTRFYGSAIPKIAFGSTIAGFAIYVVGRFFVATNRRRKRPVITRNDATDRKDEE